MEHLAPAAGTRIAYSTSGTGGPVVLLVAGTGYNGGTWHPELLRNLEQDHTVVVYDHRGTGESAGTDDAYTTQLFADDAFAVIEHAGLERVHLVGHSMGGRVAQLVALDHPERVASLVLASSGTGGQDPLPLGRVGVPVSSVVEMVERGYDRDYVKRAQLRTFFTPEFAAAHPEEVEWLADAFWDRGPSLVDYLKHVQARQAHATGRRVGELRLPTLVTVGDRDTHAGGTGSHLDASLDLDARLPDSTLRVLPGLKHGVFWQDPALLADLVRQWTAAHAAVLD